MRRIDLRPYPSHLDQLDPVTKQPTGEKLTIQVLPSLVEIMFAAAPKDPLDFLKKAKFAERLEAHTGESVTVEDHEWAWLHAGLDASGIKERQFAELVRRVIEADQVEVPNGQT